MTRTWDYAVDAIHLDYIRYPGNEWGYGRRSLLRYRNDTGATGTPKPTDPAFTTWRSEQVTEEVRAIRAAVRNASPTCEVTAAVLTWGEISGGGYHATGGYRRGLQDWPVWCDEGLIDGLYPMHYKREHNERWRLDYRRWFDEIRKSKRPGGPRIVIGQGSYMNSIEDSVTQLRDALAAGFDGFCIFSYRTPDSDSGDRDAFGAAVRHGTTKVTWSR